MIKKAMILAAGFGKRLNPLTINCPKPLLKIGNQTLLSNTLKFLKLFGIKKVIIIPVTCMLLFDGFIVYMFYAIGTTKIQMMMGIMLGTILKIITFILYLKYLSDE